MHTQLLFRKKKDFYFSYWSLRTTNNAKIFNFGCQDKDERNLAEIAIFGTFFKTQNFKTNYISLVFKANIKYFFYSEEHYVGYLSQYFSLNWSLTFDAGSLWKL